MTSAFAGLLLPLWVCAGPLLAARLAPSLPRALLVSLGLLAGLGLSTLPAGLAIAAGAADAPAWTVPVSALVVAGLAYRSPLLGRRAPAAAQRAPRALLAALAVAAALALLSSWLYALQHPDGAWDGWAIWSLRARFLARGGARVAFGPEIWHPDYPLLVPILVATGWGLAGSEGTTAPIGVGLAFCALGTLCLGLGLARLRGPAAGMLAATALLATPLWSTYAACQQAEVPLGALALAAAVAAALAVEEALPRRALALAGLLAGLAAWTKNEGLLPFAGLGLGLLLRRGAPLPARVRDVCAYTLGALPPLSVLLAFKLHVRVPNDLLGGAGASSALALLLEPRRWTAIAAHCLTVALTFADWGLLLLAAPLAVAAARMYGVRGAAGQRVVGAWLLFQAAGVSAVYLLLGPRDLSFLLVHSADRLLLQAWPGVLLWLGLHHRGALQPATSPSP